MDCALQQAIIGMQMQVNEVSSLEVQAVHLLLVMYEKSLSRNLWLSNECLGFGAGRDVACRDGFEMTRTKNQPMSSCSIRVRSAKRPSISSTPAWARFAHSDDGKSRRRRNGMRRPVGGRNAFSKRSRASILFLGQGRRAGRRCDQKA